MAAKKRKKKPREEKADALRRNGGLNPHPEKVTDSLFQENEFFDALDSVQVKYEMLRRVQIEGEPASGTAHAFGLSRPSFYQAKSKFDKEGIAGLIPKKRGPRGAHKLTDGILEFAERVLEDEAVSTAELAERIEDRFGVVAHPRSIERAIERKKKRQ